MSGSPSEIVPRQRGPAFAGVLASWLTVVVLVGVIVGFRNLSGAQGNAGGARIGGRLIEIQARYMVGAGELAGPNGKLQLYQQAEALNVGSPQARLKFVVLAGELAGPSEAIARLNRWDALMASAGVPVDPDVARARQLLGRLYADYSRAAEEIPQLSPIDREFLARQLGWFGRLALTPAGSRPSERADVLAPARRTAVAFILALLMAALVGLIGLVSLIVVVVSLSTGYFRTAMAEPGRHGRVYAETFAVWLTLFMIFSLTASVLPARGFQLALAGGAMLLSLSALGWPLWRGLSWNQIRQDIGLTRGRGLIAESCIGFATYAMALPILAVGILLTLLLMAIQARLQGGQPGNPMALPDAPYHPVVDVVLQSGLWGRIQVLLLASVVAPLVEETMFRGVLYRHLREGTRYLGSVGGALTSATISGFVFAAVHPQGVVAIPALMALAYAFCLAREWRGSLIPCMIAHGLNNGLVMLGLLLVAGD